MKTAEEKLLSAQVLLQAGHYADAASRAYYCAFHSISAVLLSRNLTFSSHGQTIGAFNREFVKSGIFPKHFGRWLIKMQKDREAGDYRTHSLIGAQIAAEDVSMAEEILSLCRQYLESIFESSGYKDLTDVVNLP
ncbi:MAG: HEPN domain-containing protein [candidate division KSB1 bacterium]|nr:HEPN domain-containing protein [candidate division KSB1 bacterium]